MDHGKNECSVNHKHQNLNDFNASYEDLKTRIPGPLDGKDQVASHAKYIECWNRDPNYIGEDSRDPRASIKYHTLAIDVLLRIMILLVTGIIAFGFVFFLLHTKSYSFQRDGIYKICMKTDQYGIEFYVKSDFDKKYLAGTPTRVELEKNVIKDYIEDEKDYCHNELRWKWQSADPNYPTPSCNKLQLMGINPVDP